MPLDDSDILPIANYNADRNGSNENDAKEFRKKLRNRQSAQRARDRQKARMRWLEREVALLTVRNQALESENIALKSLLGDGVCDTLWRGRVGDIKPRKGILERKHEVVTYDNCDGNSQDLSVVNITNNGRSPPKPRLPTRTNHHSQCESGERVAVISPMARVDNRNGTKKLPRHGIYDEALKDKKNKVTKAEENPTATTDLKHGTAEQARLANSANLQHGFPLSGRTLAANYYTLLSSRYFAPFLQKVAFANSFPDVHQDREKELGYNAENTKNMVNTSEVVDRINSSSLAHSTNTYCLLPSHPYSMLDPPGSVPVGILPVSDSPHNSRYAAELEGGRSIKRHKMNSVESECSSQTSSESDMIPSQC